MGKVLIGESKIDDRGRVVLPQELRSGEKLLFFVVYDGDKKYYVVEVQ